MSTRNMVWTPFLVERYPKQYRWIAVFANYDEYNDWFTVSIDGHSNTWYRRGQRYFKTRRECLDYSRGVHGFSND